jgi:hypothetical protein
MYIFPIATHHEPRAFKEETYGKEWSKIRVRLEKTILGM